MRTGVEMPGMGKGWGVGIRPSRASDHLSMKRTKGGRMVRKLQTTTQFLESSCQASRESHIGRKWAVMIPCRDLSLVQKSPDFIF